MNVNLQYLYRFVEDFRPSPSSGSLLDVVAMQQAALSGQTRRHQHGASARVSYKWLHDTLEAEVAAAGYARPRGAVLRPLALLIAAAALGFGVWRALMEDPPRAGTADRLSRHDRQRFDAVLRPGQP